MAWHAKTTGSYSRTSQEAIDNANMIYAILASKGWSLNAVSGVLGNMASESGYNPWRWQGDHPLASTDPYYIQNGHAYGLVQFDPASKYIDHAQSYTGYGPKFSNTSGSLNDGTAQMLYINDHADYYPTRSYPETYAEFKVNTKSPEWNARAWFYNYERGTWDTGRETAARYWYDLLGGGPTPPIPGGTLPIWLMKYIKDKRLL